MNIITGVYSSCSTFYDTLALLTFLNWTVNTWEFNQHGNFVKLVKAFLDWLKVRFLLLLVMCKLRLWSLSGCLMETNYISCRCSVHRACRIRLMRHTSYWLGNISFQIQSSRKYKGRVYKFPIMALTGTAPPEILLKWNTKGAIYCINREKSHFMWNKCLTKDQPVPRAEAIILVLLCCIVYTDFVADVGPIPLWNESIEVWATMVKGTLLQNMKPTPLGEKDMCKPLLLQRLWGWE